MAKIVISYLKKLPKALIGLRYYAALILLGFALPAILIKIFFSEYINFLLVYGVFFACLIVPIPFIQWLIDEEKRTGKISLTSFLTFIFFSLISLIHFFSLTYRRLNITDNFLDSYYFSATTFASLGLGDFLPQGELAKVTVAAEAIFGYLYMGMIVIFAMRTLSSIVPTKKPEDKSLIKLGKKKIGQKKRARKH